MLPALRDKSLLAFVAVVTLVAMGSAARAADGDASGLQHTAFALANEASVRLMDWLEHGYARRPAVLIGLGAAFAIPLLVLAGALVHRKRGARSSARSAEADDCGPPVLGARLALDGRSAIMLPPGRDLVQIGRLRDNDICIEDESVQHYHAVIERLLPAGFAITDVSGLGGHGLRINGEPCLTAVLANGDLVEVGRARMRFEVQH